MPAPCRGWLTATYITGVAALYVVYFFLAIRVFQKHGLTNAHLENISNFYLRISGVLFIIVESLIAVLLVRGLAQLKNYYERTGPL